MELRLEIDPLRLDEEWVGQPAMREAWGVKHADAKLAYEEARASLSVVDAELDRDIREDPTAFGLAKLTESAVGKVILGEDLHISAVKRINKARHRMDVLQAAIDGLEHRKRALTELVELHGQEYYAAPSVAMPAGVKNRRRDDDSD